MDKLSGIHPVLKMKVLLVLEAMRILGFPMMVFEGVRTAERQNQLYQQGRSKPGNIVTNCDGYKTKSPHQPKDDGYGHAVDCVFLDNGKPSWNMKFPWKLFGEAAKSQSLVWGGDFRSIRDYPHIELL